MARGKSLVPVVSSLASLVFLVLVLWGIGLKPFWLSFEPLLDTQWDLSYLSPTWGQRFMSLLWLIPVGLGFLGWSRLLKGVFFPTLKNSSARFLGLSLTLSLFSLYVLFLGVNGLIYWPLTALFFVPAFVEGWKEWRLLAFREWVANRKNWIWLGVAPVLIWSFEYLSPPLVWDAVLDHFRYAREVSRLHQIPYHWVNHTGDMPKAAELILAGFWNLGGEPLSKLSLVLPALLTGWLLLNFKEEKENGGVTASWIFWTCPYFLALYAFGYVEGFLAFFEFAALFCIWKGLEEPKKAFWLPLAALFLGTALVVKYTAVLAIGAVLVLLVYERVVHKKKLEIKPIFLLAFVLPFFPWFLKNWLAFGNPVYPLATALFGSHIGYNPEMEKGLLLDTGVPWEMGWSSRLQNLWNSFFTADNQVGAAWTPLVVMSLPWFFGLVKDKLGQFLLVFSGLFVGSWFLVSSSVRHVSGAVVVLALLSAMAWQLAFKEKRGWGRPLFVTGLLISVWLSFSTQLGTTAPYASALGLEDPLLRLKRHYSLSTETYEAYRFIESHSDPADKVMAFAVWQTYPLQRMAFVDFKWKRPILLEWATHCHTAEQLAQKFHEEGVAYFLFQRWETDAMSKVERDFKLEGMPLPEYKRFWGTFLEPVLRGENVTVYRVRWKNPT